MGRFERTIQSLLPQPYHIVFRSPRFLVAKSSGLVGHSPLLFFSAPSPNHSPNQAYPKPPRLILRNSLLASPHFTSFTTSPHLSHLSHLTSSLSLPHSSFTTAHISFDLARTRLNGIVASPSPPLSHPHSFSAAAMQFLSNNQTRARLPWIGALCALFLIWSLVSLGVNLKPFTITLDVRAPDPLPPSQHNLRSEPRDTQEHIRRAETN